MAWRPVCAECLVEMTCRRNGVEVYLAAVQAIAQGDLYACPECGCRVVTSFGVSTPINVLAGDRRGIAATPAAPGGDGARVQEGGVVVTSAGEQRVECGVGTNPATTTAVSAAADR
jgi:hypothetical protein